jgi:hypothetical protein
MAYHVYSYSYIDVNADEMSFARRIDSLNQEQRT